MGIWKDTYGDDGLDFRHIEWFDEWLIKADNYKRLLPEQKGVLVFRPRRYQKKYDGYDPLLKAEYDRLNSVTYLLIRNGENLYRVFTEKITISPRLFPQRKELDQLIQEVNKEIEDAKGWSNEDRRIEESKDKVDDLMYKYKKRAVLLQGLIDRTEIFQPLKKHISIFKMEEAEGLVNFIYDDEATLPSGRLPFKDWWDDINSKINEGSRILMTGHYAHYRYGGRKDFSERFYLAKNSYDGLKNVPDLPKEGVYVVEEFTSTNSTHYKETRYKEIVKEYDKKGTKYKYEGILKGKYYIHPDEKTGSKDIHVIKTFGETDLTIMYKPKEEASKGWNRWDTHERKARARFKIYREDSFVINYDQINLEDIEFYLTSRVDRPNYLDMMPVLEKIKVHLLDERKKEVDFIKLIAHRMNKTIDEVNEAVIWWKFKNKWKRPIEKDDALALRMIEKRLSSKK